MDLNVLIVEIVDNIANIPGQWFVVLTRSRIGLLQSHFVSFECSPVSKHADCVLLVVVGVDTLAVLGTGLLGDVLGRRGLGEQHKPLRLSVLLQI